MVDENDSSIENSRTCSVCRFRISGDEAVWCKMGKKSFPAKQIFCSCFKSAEDNPTGYHSTKITKGVLGESSKITEEYEEFLDAVSNNNPVMALCELSDLIGAVEAYAKKYNITLEQLIEMKDATARAFASGNRK